MNPQGLLSGAENLVRRALANGADEAEVFAAASRSMSVEIEAGEVAMTSMDDGRGVALRIIKGGRLGFAYASNPDDAKIVDAAIRLSRSAPDRGYSFPSPTTYHDLALWNDDVAAMDPSTLQNLVADLRQGATESAPNATMSGGVSLDAAAFAIASSAGVATCGRSTSAEASASLVLNGTPTVSVADGRDAIGIPDAYAAACDVGDMVMRLSKPEPLHKTVNLPVVLLPMAAAELVGGLLGNAIMGDNAQRGRSIWADQLDTAVLSPNLSLYDDPLVATPEGTFCDDEGMATQRLPIVENGVLRRFLYDSWDAHHFGAIATPSAIRSGTTGPPQTGTHRLSIEVAGAKKLDALLADVGEGLLIHSVLGAHTANEVTGEFSVTAPNVFHIRDGQWGPATQDVALAGNLPHLLRNLNGGSTERRELGGAVLGALWLDGVSVSV